MDIKLAKPFAANSAVGEYDVKQIKKSSEKYIWRTVGDSKVRAV